MISVKRYEPENKAEWNEFVLRSKNGTFLFDRNYMDYHADRYEDHSLLFLSNKRIYALLPAHSEGSTLCSHMGLSYGGLIMDSDCTAAGVLEVFSELRCYMQANGFRTLLYKAIPWCYHIQPAQEDLYALYRIFENVRIKQRDIATLLIQRTKMRWRKDRRRALRRAVTNDVVVAENNDFTEFWQLLNSNLEHKYSTKPVHSLSEIMMLKSRFPDKIRLFESRKDGELLGGLVVYLTPQVVRGQYSSATAEGKKLGAMDAIKEFVLNKRYREVPYFDFGNSNEDHGKYLNEALISQKEGFGGRGMCYDIYECSVE